MTSVVWFRDDLRVADNPALAAGFAAGIVVAVFVYCDAQWRRHGVGTRRLEFTERNLECLGAELARLGIELRLLDVPWFAAVPQHLCELVGEVGATALHFNAEYALDETRRDAAVHALCGTRGIEVTTHHGGTILPPGAVLTAAGQPYSVFTPFKRRWLERLTQSERAPLPPPRRRRATQARPFELLRRFSRGTEDIEALWPAGERAAQSRLGRFVERSIVRYHKTRDQPARESTSRLSPYLAVGAISARQCLCVGDGSGAGRKAWVNELIWRDFYRHVVALFPDVSRGRPFVRAAPECVGARIRSALPRGNVAKRVTRWWMRACASCWRPAGCTTACVW